MPNRITWWSSGLVLALVLPGLISCAGQKPARASHTIIDASQNALALQHYLAGALFDFESQYEAALIEYHIALNLDSASAEILKAIGRNYHRTGNSQQAIYYLNRALRHNDSDLETLFLIAEAHDQLQSPHLAALYLSEFHKLDPFNPAVYARLVHLYTRMGELEQLIALREQMVELFGYQDEAVNHLLGLYMQFNRLEKAEDLAARLIEFEPDNVNHWYSYGEVLELRDDTTGAIRAYRRALELNPGEDEPIERLYAICSRTGRWEPLTETLSVFVRQHPTRERAIMYLAEGYFHLGDLPAAQEQVLPLLDSGLARADAHRLMARISALLQEFDATEHHLYKLTELEPWDSRAWELLATLQLQQRNFEQGAALLRSALEHVGEDNKLQSLYGFALQQMGMFEEALIPLEAAHRRDPFSMNTIVALTQVYEALGEFTTLDSLYETSLRRHPDSALLLNNYSYSLAERGVRLKEALAMVQRALEMEPNSGAYLDTIGWVYFKMGDLQQAFDFITRALRHGAGNSAEVLEHMGDILFQMGNTDQAREHWQKAQDIGGASPRLPKKLRDSSAPR